MIYFISDIHGDKNIDALNDYVKNAKEDDLLIILGDIELHFRDTDENREFSKYFEELTCKIALVDGNHENFDYLYSFPEEDWCGGRIHRISDRFIHLMRGYIFEIEGHTFLTMGGCKSSQKWFDMGLRWEQEKPTEDEIIRAYRNLKAHKNRVDYVLTHKYRIENPKANPLGQNGFMNFVDNCVEYKHWYSGHWHKTKYLDDKHTVVYRTLTPLAGQ